MAENDEPRLLGTQHLQRSVDDLKIVANTLRSASENFKQAAQAGSSRGGGQQGFFGTLWNGTPRGSDWRGKPNGGQPISTPYSPPPSTSGFRVPPTMPGASARMAAVGNGGAGGQGGWGQRAMGYAGSFGLSNVVSAMGQYANNFQGNAMATEDLAARMFPTSGFRSFDVGTTNSMARTLTGNQAYGTGRADVIAGQAVPFNTLGFGFNDPRRASWSQAGQVTAYMNPGMSFNAIQTANAGMSSARTANTLRLMGVHTLDPRTGTATDMRTVGNQMERAMGIRIDRNSNLDQIFRDQNNPWQTNLRMAGMSQDQIETLTQQQAQWARARQLGWTEERYRDVTTRATQNDQAAQNELEAISPMTSRRARTNLTASEAARDSNMIGGFSKGVQDATTVLREFTDVLDAFLKGNPGVGNTFGYGSGATNPLAGAFGTGQSIWGAGMGLAGSALQLYGGAKLLGKFGGRAAAGGVGRAAAGVAGKAGLLGRVAGGVPLAAGTAMSSLQGMTTTQGTADLATRALRSAEAGGRDAPNFWDYTKAAGGSFGSRMANFGLGGEEDQSGGQKKQEQKRSVKLQKPVNVPLSSGKGAQFGMRFNKARGVYSKHLGVDFAAGAGTPIHAAESGTVLYAHFERGLGNVTKIDHGGGIQTLYAHQSAFRVKTGQQVRQGQVIGSSGNTGAWTTGAHLHFEVHRNGTPVDPMPYLGGGGAAGSGSIATPDAADPDSDKPGQAAASSALGTSLVGSYGSISEADAIAAALTGGGASSGGGAQGSSKAASNTAAAAATSGGASVPVSGSVTNRNAGRIINAGKRQNMSNRDILIGLMTAMQESSLRNLANTTIPESLKLPHEGTGHDHDSLGLFQQRLKYWGTVEQLMNPEYASGKFFSTLKGVGGRENMSLTRAAQAVQRSAYPNAYAKHEGAAKAIMAKYKMNSYATGAWEVRGNELAQLHEGEMVVKKQTAKTIREALLSEGNPLVKGSGGGGGVTLRFEPNSVVFRVEGSMDGRAAQASAREFVDAIAKDQRIKQIAKGV